jgi:hypothetical protein
MRVPVPRLSVSFIERRWGGLAALGGLATLLELAAGTGLAYLAGFARVQSVLGHFHWGWLLALAVGLLVSFGGYYGAYQGIFRVENGPTLARGQMYAVVAAGFGGFLAHGGGVLDRYALQAAGADERDAKARAAGLAGMEQGVLAIGGCGCAIAILAGGFLRPAPSYTLPWAIIPVPGFLIAFWLAERYRDRFAGRAGWRRYVSTFLESIHLIRALFAHPLRWGWAVLGMALFWAADAFAAWAGLAAFGVAMNPAGLFVGFATGMVFTRRTGPLAGAGILALVMPLTIWISGAPFAAAIVGVFVYRFMALWLPMPASIAVLATLREMGKPARPTGATAQVSPSLGASSAPSVSQPAAAASSTGAANSG